MRRFIVMGGMLAAGGYAAYGKAVVFDADHPLGLCLAW